MNCVNTTIGRSKMSTTRIPRLHRDISIGADPHCIDSFVIKPEGKLQAWQKSRSLTGRMTFSNGISFANETKDWVQLAISLIGSICVKMSTYCMHSTNANAQSRTKRQTIRQWVVSGRFLELIWNALLSKQQNEVTRENFAPWTIQKRRWWETSPVHRKPSF